MPMTEGAIRRPVATTMIFLIIVTLGVIGFQFLPVDLMPAIEMPQLNVDVSYSNVGPEEMELLVTEPLENGFSGVANLEEINSTSREGRSSITLRFAQGVDLDEATNEVREALDRMRNALPEDASPPRINKFDPDSFPIVVMGASSNRELKDLTMLLDREIRRRFEQIPGVGAIDVYGEVQEEIRIEVARDRLLAANLTVNDITQALGRENATLPGGNVQRGFTEVYIRSMGEFTDIEQIRKTVVRMVDGVPLRVEDIANVQFDKRDLFRYIEVDERPMLQMVLRKQSGANTVEVAAAIRREMDSINASRDDLDMMVISDQSVTIQESMNSVRNSAIWGGLLAVIILMAFLRNSSTTAIIGISIPIAVIATFSLLYFGGLTLNQMSFGGLALGVGLIVDNAIVVIENIVRLRREGKPAKESAAIGTREVGGAIIASTVTTSVIFLPVLFMQTMTGTMFRELALVVVFSLACSLLVALTLVPMLASRFLSISPRLNSDVREGTGLLQAISGRYEHILDWSLKHPAFVFIFVTGLMAVSLFGVTFLSTELAPQGEADEINIQVQMDDGTNISIMDSYMTELDAVVNEVIPHDQILHYTRELRNGGGAINLALLSQENRDVNSTELADTIRERVSSAIPGMRINVRTPQTGMRMMRGGGGGEDGLQIELRGYDLQTAERLGQEIQDRIARLPEVADVKAGQTVGQPEQTIRFDRERMANIGISVNDVGRAIQASVGGTRAGVFRVNGDEIDINVRLREEDRMHRQDIDNISVRASDGSVIPISALIDVSYGRAPESISRIDSQRVSYVYANLVGGVALGDAVRLIQEELRTMDLPEGFSIVYGGEYEEQQQAQTDFIMAIVMAIALIYMVMAAQFERFLDPLIVMFSVPLAVVGVVPALLLTGTTLNMQSFMGVIMLVGIVVNNAIVLVDYINLLRREEGMELVAAVRQSAKLRFRPILMTSLTTILGLMPLALEIGAGAEMQAALARVVIGGLLASSLITLVFIPVVYVTAHRARDRIVGRIKTVMDNRRQPQVDAP